MNVNEKLMKLQEVTGYPVRPDIYTGPADKNITFTYEDERGALYADDDETATTAYLQVSLNTPENYNHMRDKHLIKKELKKLGFNVESIQSWLEDAKKGTERVRRTIFSVNITEAEEE